MIGHALGTKRVLAMVLRWGRLVLTGPDLRLLGGAGDENRTRVSSLGSWRSTIELHRRAGREPSQVLPGARKSNPTPTSADAGVRLVSLASSRPGRTGADRPR